MPILPPPPYAELCCLTNFTFLTGSSHPEEFVDRARSLGYHALAVTDECSVAGIVRAWDAWRRNPSNTLRLIVGSLIRLEDGPAVVLLATDRAAYGRLAALITRGRRAAVKGRYRLTRADLEDGLPGCLALLLPPDGPLDPPALANDAHWLATRFPGELWLAAPLLLGADDA
ncbi:MAG TPA: PHP domain-containing protein [Rhodocyclaceae bacterium]|nr:PHP domain-containing protein [Rhodocyclaceae bacterium]